MASDIPATSEVILQTDSSKQFLDTFIGQGWDKWGEGLGSTNAAELRKCSSFSARSTSPQPSPVFRPCSFGVMAVAVAGTAHEGTPFGKDSARSLDAIAL